MKEKKNKDNNKAKLTEKISLAFRRRLLVDSTITFLIVAILLVGYISLNLWIRDLDLNDIDLTENKRYTLSDASIKAVSNINQDIKIFVYGFDEKSNFINFLKQYHNANNKINYEIITEENNAALIQQYSLESGYSAVILECGDAKKVIDAASEFTTYDYTTYQSVDVTEQVMTNSILSLTEENKPKVYFLEGHNENALSQMSVLTTFLKNEAFEIDTLNILTNGIIPEDCDILAIMSPKSDFFEIEVNEIKKYINNGGKIYFTMDAVFEDIAFPNLQLVLDEYGCSIQNGYVIEQESGKYVNQGYPFLILPNISQENQITSDIYSANTKIILMYAAKINYKDDNTLSNLNVTKETLLYSSDSSLFINNVFASNSTEALESATKGSSDISTLFKKNIKTTNSEGEEVSKTSELILVSCGNFIADTNISELGASYPLSAYGSNKDFVINGLSYLAKKENILTIRKDLSSSTYMPTEKQNIIVILIIFIVPLIIIFVGILIWIHRKKRK